MEDSSFSERTTSQLLKMLPREMRAAFAAACAERLLPRWRAYAKRLSDAQEAATDVEQALRSLWSILESKDTATPVLDELKAGVLASIPDEDQAWSVGEPYAEDAAAAVAYALQAFSDETTDSAKFAARRVYEVLVNYLESAEEGTRERTAGAVPDTLVEQELARQNRDLHALAAATSKSQQIETILQLRELARSESEILFGHAEPQNVIGRG